MSLSLQGGLENLGQAGCPRVKVAHLSSCLGQTWPLVRPPSAVLSIAWEQATQSIALESKPLVSGWVTAAGCQQNLLG